MKKIEKITALMLVLVTVFTFTINANALDSLANTSNKKIFSQNYETSVARFEDVVVDDLLKLSENAIETIENEVCIDETGLYYIANEASLKKSLTDKEYSLVIEQIMASNNATVTAATEDGSEKNPYILTANTALNTSASTASNTWFRINTIRGAVNFKITTSVSASAVFYRKTLLGKKEIGSASGKSINKTISNSATNNNANNYIINVTVSSAMSSSITVGQHRDKTTTYYTRGTVWTPNDKSAVPNTSLLTMKMWYLKAEDIDKLVTFVNHSQYLTFCDKFAAGLITAAGIATTIWGNGTYAKIISIALSYIGYETSSIFKQHVLDTIDEVGGWNGTKYTNNIYMKQIFYTNQALYFTYIYKWTGSTIYGDYGYTGSFSSPA